VGQGHIHDFNPGVGADGLFWTAHVPANTIAVDFDDTTASFKIENFALLDTIPNVPATISMAMEWHGLNAQLEVKDFVRGFAGRYHECSATIAWSGEEAGFSFISDPASTSATRFAEIGSERNGVFFNEMD
jgi:hypothetical protein